MRDRVERLLGDLAARRPSSAPSTAIALVLLRRYGDRVGLARDFAILDDADQRALVQQAMAAEGVSETAFPPRAILSAISAAKNRLLVAGRLREATPATSSSSEWRGSTGATRRSRKRPPASTSTTCCARRPALRARSPSSRERLRGRVRYLLVDEFQDTNHAQLRLVERARRRRTAT